MLVQQMFPMAPRLLVENQPTDRHLANAHNTIVKRVSWFKSSLLLRIINKHTYKYSFLIKTILIGKFIQQSGRTS